MTGPYEREIRTTLVPVVRGRLELYCGEHNVTATVLSGEAEISVIEEFDAAVVTFGVDQPVRMLNSRRRLRIVVETDLDEMVIEFEPGNG